MARDGQDVITFAFAALGLAVGFGAAVWTIIGFSTWPRNRWRAFWNFQIAIADLIGSVIIGSRLLGRPLDLPSGTTTLLLLPIIVIPPAFKLHDWFVARSVASHERIL